MQSSHPTARAQSRFGGLKTQVLPLLLTFLIPAFGLWFFDRAESKLDDEVRESLLAQVATSQNTSPEEKKAASDFYESIKVSQVMASNDPSMAELQDMFEPAMLRYANFRWGKRISLACLSSLIFALLFVGAGVAWSLRSQESLYQALRLSWPVLRSIAALQVLGQGVLAVALSFWVTALWMEVYYIKLIGICAILALSGVALIYKAMLAKLDSRFDQMGELLSESQAPDLWARVREMASCLGVQAPDHIIVGIDASFYVTENDIWLDNQQVSGRSLFVSLPLLKVLDTQQADAILGHEMAHFSGEDTTWSRKIGPLLQRMDIYLAHLGQNALSFPVFHFLLFFRNLYNFSFGKMSRAREFRADKIGAEISSPAALASSLVKLVAYCEYRDKTEEEIMLHEETKSRPEMALRLEQGFPGFLSDFSKNPTSALTEVHHPFDTHPPLRDRIQALGFTMAAICAEPSPDGNVSASWYDRISDAVGIEERLWSQQEKLMMDVREVNRAMSLKPETEDDRQLIEKYFPEKIFTNPKGKVAILHHMSIKLCDWSEPVRFDQIVTMQLHDSWPKKMLHLTYRIDGQSKTVTHKFPAEIFHCENENLLDALGYYYGRHKNAEEMDQKR